MIRWGSLTNFFRRTGAYANRSAPSPPPGGILSCRVAPIAAASTQIPGIRRSEQPMGEHPRNRVGRGPGNDFTQPVWLVNSCPLAAKTVGLNTH